MASGERVRLIADAHLLLFNGDQVLLLKRSNTGFADGSYSVIAGHVDPDETVRDATAREALEEAGLIIAPADLELCHVIHRRSEQDRASFFFTAKHWIGEPVNREPHKCSELAWFSIQALPPNTIPYIRHAIAQVRQGQLYSEFGWATAATPSRSGNGP